MNGVTRALRRFVSKLTGRNKVIYFVVLFLICVVAICIAIYGQYFYKYSDTDPLMLGIHVGANKTQEEYASLKANFSNIFTNELHINSENVNIDKLDTSRSAVYTGYTLQNDDENYYHIDLQLPTININTDVAKAMNADIKEKFYDEANKIMRSTSNGFTTYQVSYVAYINDDAISIAIKKTQKVGTKAETVTVATYNYSIPDKRGISLEDLIKLKGTDVASVQEAIDSCIKTAADNSSEIAKEYGSTFTRDVNSSMYKVSNAENYFLTDDGYVYIIYAYGETAETNEIDIVIF
jgi:multidrug efflux pump subunit AcrB